MFHIIFIFNIQISSFILCVSKYLKYNFGRKNKHFTIWVFKKFKQELALTFLVYIYSHIYLDFISLEFHFLAFHSNSNCNFASHYRNSNSGYAVEFKMLQSFLNHAQPCWVNDEIATVIFILVLGNVLESSEINSIWHKTDDFSRDILVV